MKKMKLVTVVALLGLVVLGGCSSKAKDADKGTDSSSASASSSEQVQAMSPEAFGQAFTDEVIYNKASTELEKEIPSFENIKKDFNDIGLYFSHSFASEVVDADDEAQVEAKGNELNQVYNEVVTKSSKIEVKSATDDGEERTIVYNVYGIDFAQTADKYISNIMTAAAASDENADESQLVFDALKKAIQESPIKDTPVEVTLVFTKVDDIWELEDTIDPSDLILALYMGEVDEDKFDEILEQAYARFE